MQIVDFPGGLVAETLRFHSRGVGLIPGPGTKILHELRSCASWHSQKNKKRFVVVQERGKGGKGQGFLSPF